MKRQYTDISHFRAPYKNWPYLGIGAATDPATPPPAAEVTPWYKNPLYIGGALVAAAGAYFLMHGGKRTAQSNKRRRRSAQRNGGAIKSGKMKKALGYASQIAEMKRRGDYNYARFAQLQDDIFGLVGRYNEKGRPVFPSAVRRAMKP